MSPRWTYNLLWSLILIVLVHGEDRLMLFPPIGCREFTEVSLCSSGHCVEIDNVTIPGTPNSLSSTCLCNPGWSGAGDFIDMTGHDCSINLMYIKVFWSIDTGLGCILLILIFIKLIKSSYHFYHLLHNNHHSGRKITLPGGTTSTTSTTPSSPKHPPQHSIKPYPHSSTTPEHSITTSTLSDSHRILTRPETPDLLKQQRSTTPDFPSQKMSESNNNKSSPPLTPSLHYQQSQPLQPLQPLQLQQQEHQPPPHQPHQPHQPLQIYKSLHELLNWEVIKISLFILPLTIGVIIVGIGRSIGNGDQNLIGKCWWTTLSHSIVICISSGLQKRTTLQWMSIRKKVVKFTEKNAERAKQMILRTRKCLRFLYGNDVIMFIIYNLLPVFPYYQNILVILFFSLVAVATWIQAFTISRAATELERILLDGMDRLHGSSKSEREKTLQNIVRLKKSFRRSFFSPPMLIACTLWPFMRSKASYFLPFAFPFQFLSLFLVIYNCQYPTTLKSKDLMKESSGESHSKDGGMIPSTPSTTTLPRRKPSAPEMEMKQLGALPENEESSRHSSPDSTPYLGHRSLDSSGTSTPHIGSRNLEHSIRVPYLSTPSLRPLEPSSSAPSMIVPTSIIEGSSTTSGMGGTYIPIALEDDSSIRGERSHHLMVETQVSRPESRNSALTDEDLPDVILPVEDRPNIKHIFNPFYKTGFAEVGGDGNEPRSEDTN